MTESFGVDHRLTASDDPIFLDPRGRRRMWLRLTAGVTAGGGVMALAACGLLFTEGPSTAPTAIALPVVDESPGLLNDALAVRPARPGEAGTGGRAAVGPAGEATAREPRAGGDDVEVEAETAPLRSQNPAPMALASPVAEEIDSDTVDGETDHEPSRRPERGRGWDDDEHDSHGGNAAPGESDEAPGDDAGGEDPSGDDDESPGEEDGAHADDGPGDHYGDGGEYRDGDHDTDADDEYGSSEYPVDEDGGDGEAGENDEDGHNAADATDEDLTAEDSGSAEGTEDTQDTQDTEPVDSEEPSSTGATTEDTEFIEPSEEPETTEEPDSTEPTEDAESTEDEHGNWSVYALSADEWFEVVDDDRWTDLPHTFES